MYQEWLYIGVFMLVAVGLVAIVIWFAGLLSPKKPNKIKSTVYECGIETVGETWVQFKASYYIYALVFLVFDVEAVFLYPWAVAFNKLSMFAVVEGVLFLLILSGGLVYAWKKGALEWS